MIEHSYPASQRDLTGAAAPRRARLNLSVLVCAGLMCGCAAYENLKGQAQLKMDRPVDGIQSLENATRRAPTDASHKIDYLLRREETARDELNLADRLRADGKLAEAQVSYERVLQLDRGNARARAALDSLPQDARFAKALAEGESLLASGKSQIALSHAMQVLEENPQNQRAIRLKDESLNTLANLEQEKRKAIASKSILEKTVTLQFNDAPLRTVFESISRSIGLNVLMDRDVKPTAKVTIFVRDITVLDAIDFILMQNQMDKRIVNGNTIVVYPATDAKRAEYEDLTIRSFQVTNADVKYLSGVLKSMLKLKDVTADERTGILVVRDTPERIHVAAKLIAVHDVADPEIMLEVEILEVTSSRRSNLGFQPPNSFSVATPGAAGSMTLGDLRKLRSDALLASPLSATLNFRLEDTGAKLLASPRIRARNKEKAKIMIGDRVPTITNTVTPINTGSSVVTGNVTYQDVGLKLEFESQVYSNSEVGIKIGLEVSNIAAEFTDAQGGRSYQIGTRNASTNLRLKDGETQILGGLITDQDRNTASKIPGLGHLPVVGRIFGNNDGSDVRSEIVLAITPRIIRNLAIQTPEARNIFSGTSNVLRERPILAESISGLKSPAAVASPAGSTATATGLPSTNPSMPITAGPTVPAQPLLNQGGALLPPAPARLDRSVANPGGARP